MLVACGCVEKGLFGRWAVGDNPVGFTELLESAEFFEPFLGCWVDGGHRRNGLSPSAVEVMLVVLDVKCTSLGQLF